MSEQFIATLALESWRGSGVRTAARLDELVRFFMEAYNGPASRWSEATVAFHVEACRLAWSFVGSWEVVKR